MNMTCGKIKILSICSLIIFVMIAFAFAQDMKPVKPSPNDKCPVCGMFVAKYPNWVGEIIFKDGTTLFFDGAKDLFKFYFNLKKYKSNKRRQDVKAIYVTEYYYISFIDATKAFYVIGSDVYGPMGRELIPFEKESDAREFIKDHKGKKIVKFGDVTPVLIDSLD